MKKGSWILFIICVAIFVTLRFLSVKNTTQEASKKIKPLVPEPVFVQKNPLTLLPIDRNSESARKYFGQLLSHPWLLAQPSVPMLNIEMIRDFQMFEEFCNEVRMHQEDLSCEQIEKTLISTLTALQEQIPFALPGELYNVLCITEMPQEWIKAPIPFHVYKRLYLGDTEMGMPFYLDVRVFESTCISQNPFDELVTWHLEMLDGKPVPLHQSSKQLSYFSSGYRTRETAHGFAKEKRGLFVDFIEHEGRLFVLYAEGPLKTFQKQESLFKQLVGQIDE